MQINKYHQIRRRFIISVSVVLTVLAGMFVWVSIRDYNQVISGAEKRSASYASALKEHAERVFSESDSTLKELVENIQGHGGISYTQGEGFYKLISSKILSGPHLTSIYVVDANGYVIANSSKYPMNVINVADRDYFIRHRNNKDSSLFISKPFKSRLTGSWRFSLSRPLRDADGRFLGLVAIAFDTSYFENFYKTIDVGKDGRIILATTGGEILIHEPFSEKAFSVDFKQSLLVNKYLPEASAGTYQVDKALVSLTPRIISYSKLSNYPVVSVVSFNWDEVIAAWRSALYKLCLIAVLFSSFIVLISVLFLRQLRHLETKSLQLEAQQQELAVKAEMLDSALDAILLLDDKGYLLQFNNALCKLTGRSRQELETMRIHDFMPPDKADLVEGRIQQILSTGNSIFESHYLHTSGAVVPIEGHARSVEICQRRLVLSVVRDISDQKAYQQTLKNAFSEWRNTFDAVEDVVWLLDMNRRIVRANKATQSVFGKLPQQVLGLQCCQATYGDGAACEVCPFQQMLKTGKRASAQLFKDNRWFDVSVDPVVSAEGEIINAVHIVKDITNLKSSELREHVRSGILERIGRGESQSQVLTFIAASVETELPGALCSIMLVDDEVSRLLLAASPSLPDSYNRAVHRTRIAEGVGTCGTAAFRKERFMVEDITTHPYWDRFRMAQEIGLRSCWSEPIISTTGQLLGTFGVYHRETMFPGEGEIRLVVQASAFAAIAVERSRSEMERAELELQLGQSQKMEAIGHLAGGVAHDFNNLLTPIIVYADLLKRSLADDEKHQAKIDGIIKASYKARDLTQQLLSFGRKQVMQMQILDLNEVITFFYSIMRRTLRESIDIRLQLSSQAAIVNADRSKLDQVLLNLAINAQDAIGETGRIVIETGQVLIDDEYARLHPGMEVGDYILLSLEDNGCGMDDETLAHIFEPFFTTKQVGHGTGLGLANVYGIVKQHNGYIAAVSRVGSGTTFKIYLPLVNECPVGVCDSKAEDVSDYVGAETILLVEDNDMVRAMTYELLQGFGYKVYVGESPEHALELVRQIPEKIDLLLTDVVMPGMNGQQLFELINAEYPEINKVLFMSGYTNNVIVTGGVLEEGIHFLPKPFTVDALMVKVRELLARPIQ